MNSVFIFMSWIYFLSIKLLFDMHYKEKMSDLWTISWRLVQSRTTLRSIVWVLHLLHRKGMPYVQFLHKRIVTNINVFQKIPLPDSDQNILSLCQDIPVFTLCGHIAGLIITLNSKSVSHNPCQKFACKT